jgi:hypothetical protein
MDKVIMHDIEIEGDDSTHCEFMFGGFTPEGQENSDREAVMRGQISVTRLLTDQYSPGQVIAPAAAGTTDTETIGNKELSQ